MEIIKSLKNYKKSYLINDLLSGLLVAIIAMPLSIALGMQSVPEGGMKMGIITAIIAGFCVSAFGGSRFQIGGPTAAFVAIILNYYTKIGLTGLQVATLLAGVILIVLGLVKCGGLVKFMPYPITVGFTTGIGVTLLVSQIKDFCGFSEGGGDFIEKVIGYISSIKSFNLPTFLMGAGTLATIYILIKINKKLPSAFISIIFFTLLNTVIKGESFGILTIGNVYEKVSAGFNFIDFSGFLNLDFFNVIIASIVIAFLGGLESLLSATVADGMSNQKSNYNQELIGQGIANMASVMLGGLPATGAIARTSANISSGAKSSLAGVFHAVFMLIMFFLLMDVIVYIPLCALSAVLINVSINICNPKLFIKTSKFSVKDTIILLSTMLLTVFFDLTYGVVGGFAFTLILNAKNVFSKLKIEKFEQENSVKFAVNGSLNFISVNKLCNLLLEDKNGVNNVIIDASELKNIDLSSIDKLNGVKSQLSLKNVSLIIENANAKIQNKLNEFIVA